MINNNNIKVITRNTGWVDQNYDGDIQKLAEELCDDNTIVKLIDMATFDNDKIIMNKKLLNEYNTTPDIDKVMDRTESALSFWVAFQNHFRWDFLPFVFLHAVYAKWCATMRVNHPDDLISFESNILQYIFYHPKDDWVAISADNHNELYELTNGNDPIINMFGVHDWRKDINSNHRGLLRKSPHIIEDYMGRLTTNRNITDSFWCEFHSKFTWSLLPWSFLYELYVAWSTEHPDLNSTMSYGQFRKNFTETISSDPRWAENKTGCSPNKRMVNVEEPLITRYNLDNWTQYNNKSAEVFNGTRFRGFYKK